MYELAGAVRRWQSEGRAVWLVRLIETRGFSSRGRAPALAFTAGEPPAGFLLAEGVDTHLFADLFAELARPVHPGARVLEVGIADDRAVDVGLSCGGVARLLVEPVADLPTVLWDRLDAREPLCLVTETSVDRPSTTELFTPDTVSAVHARFDVDLPRLFARGSSETKVLREGDVSRIVQVLWPVPRLTVVGGGAIGIALADLATRLGWEAELVAEGAGFSAGDLAPSDAVVVLSHDLDFSGAALRDALGSRSGYVGALGSRRTQAARSAWLIDHGVSSVDTARIHGPAGLDIGAYTAPEIAISILAEIIANRSAATGGPLGDRSGPVHLTGLNAPPPR